MLEYAVENFCKEGSVKLMCRESWSVRCGGGRKECCCAACRDEVHLFHVVPPGQYVVMSTDLGVEEVVQDDEETQARVVRTQ